MTEAQQNAILGYARRVFDREADTELPKMLGKRVEQLTKQEASQAIDRLRNMAGLSEDGGSRPRSARSMDNQGGQSGGGGAGAEPAGAALVPGSQITVNSRHYKRMVIDVAFKRGWAMNGDKTAVEPHRLLNAIRAGGFRHNEITDANVHEAVKAMMDHYEPEQPRGRPVPAGVPEVLDESDPFADE